jgi:hypothetical protein
VGLGQGKVRIPPLTSKKHDVRVGHSPSKRLGGVPARSLGFMLTAFAKSAKVRATRDETPYMELNWGHFPTGLRCPDESVHRSRRIHIEANDDTAGIDPGGITGGGSGGIKRCENAVAQ